MAKPKLKVHLGHNRGPDDNLNNAKCGLWMFVESKLTTQIISEVTCKSCLRVAHAEQKRKK